MKIQGIKCYCGRVLFSRTRHDFRRCKCNETYVDGGFDYIRYGWKGETPPPTVEFELDVNATQLHEDWNEYEDKYGIIEVDDQSEMDIKEVQESD